MKKIKIINNKEVFQGKKYFKKNKNYFEGWYFKNTTNKESIAFIPGINLNNKEKKAFIQIITNESSYFINYNIEEFEFSNNPFYIKIANNFFSKEKIILNIIDKKQKLNIHGFIKYSNSKNIKTNLFNPNIMGPFSYIPFMECNHAILSMKCNSNGYININNKKIKFNNSISYIEKDWGTSFPKSYLWIQGNNFRNKFASFFISIADIPFKIFNFKGLICSLIIGNKEYRFATYNNTKIKKYNINKNTINIILKKRNYTLEIKSKYNKGNKLIAPTKGKMNKEIIESINESITIILKKDNQIIFYDTSKNCGLEIVT